MDRIEVAIAKLTFNQLNLIATQNTMSTNLDELLQKMTHLKTSQHSPIAFTMPDSIVVITTQNNYPPPTTLAFILPST